MTDQLNDLQAEAERQFAELLSTCQALFELDHRAIVVTDEHGWPHALKIAPPHPSTDYCREARAKALAA